MNGSEAVTPPPILRLEQELESTLPDDPSKVDVTISSQDYLAILQDHRKRYTFDYHRLLLSARLNRKVENMQMAETQETESKKLLVQIYEIDKDIEQYKRQVVAEERHGT